MSKLFPIIRNNPFTGQVRFLPRWTHRRPIRVIPAEEYDKNVDKPKIIKVKPVSGDITENQSNEQLQINKIKWIHPLPSSSRSRASENFSTEHNSQTRKIPKPLTISKIRNESGKQFDMLETVIDGDGNFVYSKMKNNDSRVGSILVEVKSKKEKEKKDLILLEGKRLIKDALNAGCKLEYILFSRKKELEYLKPFLPKIGAKLYKMPYSEMQTWSDLTTNPGIMGIFKVPDTESFKAGADTLPLTVICDNVREPNNLGSILRTCSGVGCKQVILTKGCVNVWDTKVLRSAMGAHFTLQVKKKLSWDDIKETIGLPSNIYIADNTVISSHSNDMENNDISDFLHTVPVLPYYGIDFTTNQHIILIIGGETEGISEESYKLAATLNGVRLNVPLSNNVDSLNTGTALGVIVFEIKRQLLSLRQSNEKNKCLMTL